MPLTEHYLADLRRSGLSNETISAADFRSLSVDAMRVVLDTDAGPCLAIPCPGVACSDGSICLPARPSWPLAALRTAAQGGAR